MEEVVTVTGAEVAATEVKAKRRKSGSSMPKGRLAPVPVSPDQQGDATSELMALGHALFEKGKVREAKIVFEGLSMSMPDDAFVRTMLGTVSLALNELPKALEYFEAALLLDPSDVAARVYRGELRLHRRKWRPAIEDFEHAIAHGLSTDPFVERARRLLKIAMKPARR
jgi:predicted Zn-dependent protease